VRPGSEHRAWAAILRNSPGLSGGYLFDDPRKAAPRSRQSSAAPTLGWTGSLKNWDSDQAILTGVTRILSDGCDPTRLGGRARAGRALSPRTGFFYGAARFRSSKGSPSPPPEHGSKFFDDRFLQRTRWTAYGESGGDAPGWSGNPRGALTEFVNETSRRSCSKGRATKTWTGEAPSARGSRRDG